MSNVYCTDEELTAMGAPVAAFARIVQADKDEMRASVSEFMDSFFRARYPMPILTWDRSVRECCATITAHRLLSVRGYSTSGGQDSSLATRSAAKELWLRDVARGVIHPLITATEKTGAIASPSVVSQRREGWYCD